MGGMLVFFFFVDKSFIRIPKDLGAAPRITYFGTQVINILLLSIFYYFVSLLLHDIDMVLICAYPATLDPFFVNTFIPVYGRPNGRGHPGGLSIIYYYVLGEDVSVRKFK